MSTVIVMANASASAELQKENRRLREENLALRRENDRLRAVVPVAALRPAAPVLPRLAEAMARAARELPPPMPAPPEQDLAGLRATLLELD